VCVEGEVGEVGGRAAMKGGGGEGQAGRESVQGKHAWCRVCVVWARERGGRTGVPSCSLLYNMDWLTACCTAAAGDGGDDDFWL